MHFSVGPTEQGRLHFLTLSPSPFLACRNLKGELPDNFEEIFHSVDVDNSAEINYNEFVAAAMCRRITIDEEKLMLTFESLDLDNTGMLENRKTWGGYARRTMRFIVSSLRNPYRVMP